MSVHPALDLEWTISRRSRYWSLRKPAQPILRALVGATFLPHNRFHGHDCVHWIRLDSDSEHHAAIRILKGNARAIFDEQTEYDYSANYLFRSTHSVRDDRNHQLPRKPHPRLFLRIDLGQAVPSLHPPITCVELPACLNPIP